MLPTLQIGPLSIPVPAFSLIIALWLGNMLAEKYAPRQKMNADAINNLVFTGLIAGVIGGRIGYIMQFPLAFVKSPISVVSLNPGLFDLTTGAAFGILGMLIYGQRAKLSFWNTLDSLALVMAVLAVGLAVSHVASGQAYGAETTLPWGISLWSAVRHPSQFYELFAAGAILLLLIRQVNGTAPSGASFLFFAAVTAAAHLFLEAFRGDSSIIIYGIRSRQLQAWVILAAALFALDFRNRKNLRNQ